MLTISQSESVFSGDPLSVSSVPCSVLALALANLAASSAGRPVGSGAGLAFDTGDLRTFCLQSGPGVPGVATRLGCWIL